MAAETDADVADLVEAAREARARLGAEAAARAIGIRPSAMHRATLEPTGDTLAALRAWWARGAPDTPAPALEPEPAPPPVEGPTRWHPGRHSW